MIKGKKFGSVMERNSVFHPLHLVVFITRCDAAFVKEIGTKNDVISKIRGIDNKSRVFVKSNVLIEFRESDFSRATSAMDVVAPVIKKIRRSSVEEIDV